MLMNLILLHSVIQTKIMPKFIAAETWRSMKKEKKSQGMVQ